MEDEHNYEFYIEWLSVFAGDLPWNSELKAGFQSEICGALIWLQCHALPHLAAGPVHEVPHRIAFVPREAEDGRRGVGSKGVCIDMPWLDEME